MRYPREEQSMSHPRNERRILPLLSLLILLCICYVGESCIRGKSQSLVKQPEQIKKPRRSPRGSEYDLHFFWTTVIIRMTLFCT